MRSYKSQNCHSEQTFFINLGLNKQYTEIIKLQKTELKKIPSYNKGEIILRLSSRLDNISRSM